MPLTTGERILDDRYVVEDILGRGSMGVVARATHLSSGKIVAVKVLAEPDKANAEVLLKRFEREALLLSRVTAHPNIVSLLDHGALPSGEPCLVMEYVEGSDLERRLARLGSIPWDEVVPLAMQILDALEAVHSAGVLHRDLKPSNVLLTGDDLSIVKLSDFGVAKPFDEDVARLTRTGRIVGTPLYMAPEQMLQLPMTTASDLYALGLMLHELLVGAIPFGKHLKGVRRRLRDELPAPNAPAHQPPIPSGLRDLVCHMTRIDPDDRLDLAEFSRRLGEFRSLSHVSTPREEAASSSTPAALLQPDERAHGLLISRLGARVLRRRADREQLDRYVEGIGAAIVVDNQDWVVALTCDDADTLDATIEALVEIIGVMYHEPSCVWITLDKMLTPSPSWAFGEMPDEVAALRSRLD